MIVDKKNKCIILSYDEAIKIVKHFDLANEIIDDFKKLINQIEKIKI